MADWPSLAQVKAEIGATGTAGDETIALALAAAIEQVTGDVGVEEPIEDPTASMALAALVLAVMAAKAPDAPYGVAAVFDAGALRVAAQHPSYLRLLVGQRERWAMA